MVDSNDILSGTPTNKKLQEVFQQRWKGFVNSLKDYERPEQGLLQESVEATTKCGKCKGGVRAVLADAVPSAAFAYDLEILVSLNCRDAACAWTANQWRTWVRTKPTEL
jgi:uncharacterized protein with PIN domain